MVKGVSCRTVGGRLVEPEVLSRIECELVVSRKLGTCTDFQLLDVKLAKLEDDGLGFMSEQFTICVTVRLADGTTTNYSFFAKTIPRHTQLREDFVKAYGCFDREVCFYSVVTPMLKSILGDVKKKMIPECYFSTKNTLVFDDFVEDDFVALSCGEELDYQHCSLVLKALAKFHAASIVYEETKSREGSNVYRITNESTVDLSDRTTSTVEIDGKSRNWFDSCVKTIEPLIDLLPKYKGKDGLCDAIRSKLADIRQLAKELLSPSEETRNVVCHGDLWVSNLLFRYNGGGNDKPVDVRFVDFQMARYLPPSSDVMTFLHLTTRRNFRERYEERLLEYYHKELTLTLEAGGVSTDRVIPWEDFLSSCTRMRQLGRVVAAAFCPTILMPTEHTESILRLHEDFERFLLVDRGQEVCHCFRKYPAYRGRIQEVIEELVDHCVL